VIEGSDTVSDVPAFSTQIALSFALVASMDTLEREFEPLVYASTAVLNALLVLS
jgi:hypothetical protein